MSGPTRTWFSRLREASGRLWARLLLVNLVVVLVPVAGLEFARIYERQLLSALERDMNDQASLTRAVVEHDLLAGVALGDPRHTAILQEAAKRTRTRVRLLDPAGNVVADSHGEGPPEGREPPPPRLFRSHGPLDYTAPDDESRRDAGSRRGGPSWPPVEARREVKEALSGRSAAQTRIAYRPKAVFLFTATPIFRDSASGSRSVAGAVYVTRSTLPVLFELHRIRSSLFKVVGFALLLGAGVTLLLAFSISRPLSRLSKAAKRIAAGQRDVVVPVAGTGEIRELSESFRTMTAELDARLRYISDFSADVAHEFKSPLTSIRGAAELLAEGAHEDPAARKRFLENILLDAERLDRLVTRLLVLSRIEASAEAMTLVDLRSLLESVIRRCGERGPIELRYDAKQSWVRGRETDLETAFANLIENAQRYSPDGESVKVRVTESDRGIVVSVEDEGPGIPEARRGKIFDRFYTTDGDRGGTGLGLAIVSSVARAHGGRVTIESVVGEGSRFSVWLPGGPR